MLDRAAYMKQRRDQYFVAMKVLLRDGDKLLITHDIFGDWDIPGGRIRASEFESSLESVIERKMHEELGENVKYQIGEPRVFFRVARIEQATGEEVHIFAVGFEAQYLGGDIKLGEHHDRMEWVDVKTFEPGEYFSGGWLKGISEYKAQITSENKH